MPTYTERIVDFTLNTKYEDIPSEPLDEARKASFDCIGVTLAGLKDPAGQIPTDWARELAGNPLSVLGRNGIGLTNSSRNNCDPLIHSRKKSY